MNKEEIGKEELKMIEKLNIKYGVFSDSTYGEDEETQRYQSDRTIYFASYIGILEDYIKEDKIVSYERITEAVGKLIDEFIKQSKEYDKLNEQTRNFLRSETLKSVKRLEEEKGEENE